MKKFVLLLVFLCYGCTLSQAKTGAWISIGLSTVTSQAAVNNASDMEGLFGTNATMLIESVSAFGLGISYSVEQKDEVTAVWLYRSVAVLNSALVFSDAYRIAKSDKKLPHMVYPAVTAKFVW